MRLLKIQLSSKRRRKSDLTLSSKEGRAIEGKYKKLKVSMSFLFLLSCYPVTCSVYFPLLYVLVEVVLEIYWFIFFNFSLVFKIKIDAFRNVILVFVELSMTDWDIADISSGTLELGFCSYM